MKAVQQKALKLLPLKNVVVETVITEIRFQRMLHIYDGLTFISYEIPDFRREERVSKGRQMKWIAWVQLKWLTLQFLIFQFFSVYVLPLWHSFQ